MPNSSCTNSRPATPYPMKCDAGICPKNYKWEIELNSCDKPCGGGTLLICYLLSCYLLFLYDSGRVTTYELEYNI